MAAITIDATGVGYLAYLPWLLLCSLLVSIIDVWCRKNYFADHPYEPAGNGRVVLYTCVSYYLSMEEQLKKPAAAC
ncbi:hypothetical protein [Alteribacillus bidgolensis]|uniref:hypothetical protein n=1 Tax=Alteribacillus bidgolensis TaxID=930129 RepID=UPI000A4FB24D|nr:hypothetical protein [Alteribacillus bidgolensis]